MNAVPISFQVKEIAIDGRYFNQMTEKFSKKALQTGGNIQPPIHEFLENAVIVSTTRGVRKGAPRGRAWPLQCFEQ